MLLASLVAQPRPAGCPQLAFGSTLIDNSSKKILQQSFEVLAAGAPSPRIVSSGLSSAARSPRRTYDRPVPTHLNVATAAPQPEALPPPHPGAAPVPVSGPRRGACPKGNAAKNVAAQQTSDSFIIWPL